MSSGEQTLRPTNPWLATAVAVAVVSVLGAIIVRNTVATVNQDRFTVAANAAESELEDRISGFGIVALVLPVAMSPDTGGITLDTVEAFMAGESVASSAAIASLMDAFPLDGFSALGFAELDPGGDPIPTMLPNTAGLTTDTVLLPSVVDAVSAALDRGTPVTSDPFTAPGKSEYRYVHATPITDGLASLAFVNAAELVGGAVDNAGARLVQIEVHDVGAATTVVITEESDHPELMAELSMPMLGRDWLLHATPGPDFAWQDPGLPAAATLTMGLLIALLVYAVGVQTRRRSLVQEERLRVAEETNADKDRFIAAMSHELRTPLTSIVGLAEEMADAPDSFALDEIGELSRIMAQQSNEMALLVEDLLVAARSQAGTVTLQPEPTELLDQIRMVVSGLGDHADRVTIVEETAEAWCDPLRARQVVRNLITNAMRHGGPTITVATGGDDDAAFVEVTDDGPGVHGEARERMFEPYYRSAVVSGQAPSVGLGLSVARGLALLMDGDITYRYDEGRSIFRLTLPAVLIEHEAPARRSD